MENIHKELSKWYFAIKENPTKNIEDLLMLELMAGELILNLNRTYESLQYSKEDMKSLDFYYDTVDEIRAINTSSIDRLIFNLDGLELIFCENQDGNAYSFLKIKKGEDSLLIFGYILNDRIKVIKAYSSNETEIQNLIDHVV